MFKYCLFFVFSTLLISTSNAQKMDSLLTYEQFLLLVYKNHPIAKQINLLKNKAELELNKAKAGFDPTLNANWDSKNFKKKNYYNILNAHIDIPVWNGISVETGYNYTNGDYLNPENNLPISGQAYLGIKASLLKGLWTNERRAAIQQANILVDASDVEIQLAINDLLFNAALAYWEWSEAYNNWSIVKESLGLINQQLSIAKSLNAQGDIPAIDTLKAFIQQQDRVIVLQEQQLALQTTAQSMSAFLWNEAQQPIDINYLALFPTTLVNQNVLPLSNDFLINTLNDLAQHPWIQYYDYKLQNLTIDRRLKTNKLLPKLDLKYNFISTDGIDFFDNSAGSPIQNYKLGLKFSMPLFLRKERMDLKLNKLKQQETNYQQIAKRQDLTIKIKNYFAAVQTYANQTKLTIDMIKNYQLLLDAEQTKFRVGESSLFLINTRETQLFIARQKLIKQQISYLKYKTKLRWVVNSLDNNLPN